MLQYGDCAETSTFSGNDLVRFSVQSFPLAVNLCRQCEIEAIQGNLLPNTRRTLFFNRHSFLETFPFGHGNPFART